MERNILIGQIRQKKSFLSVGLDSDLTKIPKHLFSEPDPIFAFNKVIIDSTHDITPCYKINIAFYEAMGVKGWETLAKTLDYIPDGIFTIADAKRGDIGNTSKKYAEAFFKEFQFDSITVAPYMGRDSVQPFLKFSGKWVILLALTSNKGSQDFQFLQKPSGEHLYEEVLRISQTWGENIMYVIGATHPEEFENIRSIVPDHFLLVPGVGAQGGSLQKVCQYGMNEDVGLLINSSRGIIYASDGEDFGEAARSSALKLQKGMAKIMQ